MFEVYLSTSEWLSLDKMVATNLIPCAMGMSINDKETYQTDNEELYKQLKEKFKVDNKFIVNYS